MSEKEETKEIEFYIMERPKRLTVDIVLHIVIMTELSEMFIVGG